MDINTLTTLFFTLLGILLTFCIVSCIIYALYGLCQALIKDSFMTYDSGYGMYFWNWEYKKIKKNPYGNRDYKFKGHFDKRG